MGITASTQSATRARTADGVHRGSSGCCPSAASSLSGRKRAAKLSTYGVLMLKEPRTVIVTGASQGIGAGIVKTFLARGYAVVATSRDMTKSGAFVPSEK